MHALAQLRFTGTSPAASILGCCAFHSMSEAPCLTEPHFRAGKNDPAYPLQFTSTIRFDVSRYYRRGLQYTSLISSTNYSTLRPLLVSPSLLPVYLPSRSSVSAACLSFGRHPSP
ncbi:hypothetical protein D6C89_10295 [Aureobasidium pullulans]|uniref:Uncharacterized protein n=1 Tax=Aureobasidium pullulans TaxID=5580 RepID=A0A4V4KI79_AURPU|nr:hypothetical protein D6D24_09005 [Aureobasidium pullulans]THZ14021.1 hypothetical protein D6C89_10295 [Aureobasidium pullulans]